MQKVHFCQLTTGIYELGGGQVICLEGHLLSSPLDKMRMLSTHCNIAESHLFLIFFEPQCLGVYSNIGVF